MTAMFNRHFAPIVVYYRPNDQSNAQSPLFGQFGGSPYLPLQLFAPLVSPPPPAFHMATNNNNNASIPPGPLDNNGLINGSVCVL